MSTKKDLSYNGRAERLRAELLDSIKSITAELKREMVGVTLKVQKNTLKLRYTDPNRNQREISPPGVKLTRHGVELARKTALKISRAIESGEYSDEWVRTELYKDAEKVPVITWGDVMTGWEDRWMQSRRGSKTTDRQKLRTLNGYRSQIKLAGLVGDTEVFNTKLVTTLLSRQDEGTDKRFRLREVLSVLCTLYDIKYDFKGIGKRPTPAARELPSDDDIVRMWESFSNITKSKMSDQSLVGCYRWYFAVLATYGLRPQELFAIDIQKSFKPESNYWLCLDDTLTDGLKTGNRWIAPLHPHWVNLFDIPALKLRTNWRGSMDVQTWAASVGVYFSKHKIGVKPYDLRHAYAIRARKAGLSLDDRADLLGHDTVTHSKQYQRWISIEDRILSVQMALDRNSVEK